MKHVIDPKLDLVLERHADVSPAQVWKAWTRPEQVAKWLAPRPWTTAECEIALRPGGRFKFVMRSPEGQLFPNVGCYLEVVPTERLVWTDALLPGFRPSAEPFFTAIVTLESDGKGGTKYTAIAMHGDEEGLKKHEAMGFHEGWGQVFKQLVEHIKSSSRTGQRAGRRWFRHDRTMPTRPRGMLAVTSIPLDCRTTWSCRASDNGACLKTTLLQLRPAVRAHPRATVALVYLHFGGCAARAGRRA